jgi:hypothetical protein
MAEHVAVGNSEPKPDYVEIRERGAGGPYDPHTFGDFRSVEERPDAECRYRMRKG